MDSPHPALTTRFDDMPPEEWQADPRLAYGKGYDDGWSDGWADALAAADAAYVAAIKIAFCGRDDVGRADAIERFIRTWDARAYRVAERALHALDR